MKKIISTILVLTLVLSVSMASTFMTQPSKAAAAGTGQFYVSGTSIIDPNGNTFIIKGTNVNGPYWPWSRETSQDANLIADVWGFNAVRIDCFPRLEYNRVPNYQNLDAIINAFTSKGVVCIIENHDVTGRYPETRAVRDGEARYPSLAEMRNWWINIANTYKNNTYVWFNIMNEPGPGTYTIAQSIDKWKVVHDDIVTAIRAAGANNIVIMDDHNWGQAGGYINGDADSAVQTNGQYFTQKFSNIAFSLHMYSMWSSGADRLANYINAAAAKGLNIHIGEYGSSDPGSASATEAMFNVCVPNNIGRINWHWAGGDDHDLTAGTSEGGGWEIDRTDGIKPGNLTWMGSCIWDDNHNQLALPVVSPYPSLTNGGFEEGMADWMNWGGASVVTNDVHSGLNALKISSGATGGAGEFVNIVHGATYKFGAWAKVDSASGQIDLGIKYKVDGVQYQHTLSFTGTTYEYKELTFTMPATGQLEELLCFIWKPTTTANAYVDDLSLVRQ